MGIPVMSRFQNPFVYGCFEKVGNFSYSEFNESTTASEYIHYNETTCKTPFTKST